MKYKKLISFLAFFLAVLSVYGQNPFILKSGEPVTIACGNSEEEVVHTALNLLNRDVESVFSTRIIVTPESKKGMIIVGTIGQSDLIDKAGVDLSPIKNKKEAFLLAVSSTGKLVIAGSDKRGTAYGVMELSRLIGVSPWEWWADATPAKKEIFQLPASYRNVQSPSVEYRGIFINDEDWGLTPWSWQTYEPSDVKGQIGPKTHERIFELLLRLRANTFWPAMHGCSVPFYFTPGNKEVADKFGIFIGTSHCEPMMRNTNGEWKRDGVGEYDYVHNSAHVLSFWEQRVKEVAELDNLYTLGMRGVHDGAMNGAKTIEEQKAVLTKVLKDQRDLLTKYVNKDVTQVPQVFIPYKEVLDVYHAGLQVPDEVTLMWCDDNYGYIRHFLQPAKKEIFQLPASYRNVQSPSVEYRGIFINDEDWGLTPWSWQTYEPSDVKGQIGPKTHERIFELLLRLRANTFWPAMHGCSVPFYFTPGNKEVADKFGIFIGTSHCEPMMRNTNGEWKRDGVGEYDYVHNSAHVLSFWEQRVKEVAGLDNLYTLGMRGVHDGAMNGAKTIEEQKAVLTKVLRDQRDLLTKYVNKDVTQVPQVFIPYKEVLDVYHAGLQVPDEVTLMWCDDNYGYIRHFPTAAERARKGGNGVYYHVSYWGRPHDYLWLGTVHPSLVYQQMSLAYERGIQKMWILNVGDIKPAEYQVELFLDMAWNLEAVKRQGVVAHQRHFLEREFGKNRADRLQPVMQEAYRLAYIRKPEFMGNTRTEEKDPKFKVISDLPWSEQEINERLAAYRQLSDKVEQEWRALPAQKKETYFQLVKYPVQAAAQMNNKLLTAQLARRGKADWADSDRAYDSIVSLTKRYNTTKWNRMMDFQPRRLPVFNRVERKALSSGLPEKRQAVYTWNGADCAEGVSAICEGLGYEGKAVAVSKNKELTFEFTAWETDSVEVEVRLLPNHPVEGERLRFTISLDGSATEAVSYETKGRSEEWKENVLCNQAVRRMVLPVARKASHRLIFTALDEGVVLDQIYLYTPRIK